MARLILSWVLLVTSFFLFHPERTTSADEFSFDVGATQPSAPSRPLPNEISLTNLQAGATVASVKIWDDTSKEFVDAPATLFTIEQSGKLRVTSLVNGRYRVTISHGQGAMAKQVVVPLVVKNRVLTVESDTPTPPAISLTGTSNSLPTLYAAFPQHKQGQFEDLVLDTAKGWGATGRDRRNYVFHFDYTPEDTCGKIATILRNAANGIGTSIPVADVDKEMKGRFEQFYAEGASRFRTKNPRKEDWQPFLQHISQEIHNNVAPGLETNAAYLQIVLLELANGFDRLAKEITGLEDSVGGSGNAASGSGGNGVTGSSVGAGTCARCRRGRRCGCWSLLLAH